MTINKIVLDFFIIKIDVFQIMFFVYLSWLISVQKFGILINPNLDISEMVASTSMNFVNDVFP